ncbi:response regulator transcription factor [Actinomadura chokoriensis]|uniref:Response regulator transcription factor n=1 Tax=Actinomadura chokoriensis TaxID=454156 RepID=A0ABV4QVZ0_9ACTN
MVRVLRPLIERTTWRRWSHLVVGGALLMPYWFLAMSLTPLLPVGDTVVMVVFMLLVLPAAATFVTGLVPTVRLLEGSLAKDGDSLLFPAAIRELAARHGTSGGPPGGTRWHDRLTEREADVLRLMAKGRSNAEIAQDLFVSPQTVKTHVGNILAELHARDRIQAVLLAYETSFITPA